MKFLVVGQSVRNIACSAVRAGHTVLAADCYCDLDLISSVHQAVLLGDPRFRSQSALKGDVLELVEVHCPDAVVLGPGLEDLTLEGVTVLNNRPLQFSRVSDKLWLARWLERRGFPVVPTRPFGSHLPLPFVVKPRRGAGGQGCRLVSGQAGEGDEETTGHKKRADGKEGRKKRVDGERDGGVWEDDERQDRGRDGARTEDGRAEQGEPLEGQSLYGGQLIVQPFLEGTPASASVLGDGEEAVTLAVNEQLIGLSWAGGSGFRYCGNITPLDPGLGRGAVEDMARMAEEIVSGLGLVGSNGVDFLATDEGPVVVEVNARFQGSLDTVELAFGVNLFQAHLEAFAGRLPQSSSGEASCRTVAGRAVIYAHQDLTVDRDLRCIVEGATDIPAPGSRIMQGEPLTSLQATGRDRAAVLEELKNQAARLKSSP
ncbi:MAG: ATP-grasp domain-containing protein [Methanosarcinales archaeon]|nr:ATP-grasp domain-containing protein [Methanosarcinales archaeon]